jgi:hypothetical protein
VALRELPDRVDVARIGAKLFGEIFALDVADRSPDASLSTRAFSTWPAPRRTSTVTSSRSCGSTLPTA